MLSSRGRKSRRSRRCDWPRGPRISPPAAKDRSGARPRRERASGLIGRSRRPAGLALKSPRRAPPRRGSRPRPGSHAAALSSARVVGPGSRAHAADVLRRLARRGADAPLRRLGRDLALARGRHPRVLLARRRPRRRRRALGPPRWSSTSEFLLAAVGSAVGLGNLLRFPYVTYAHGGAAFLIPYGLAVVCLGVPVLWMELMLGQVLQRGVVDGLACLHARAWGVGVAATLAAFLLASYYSAIMSWVWVFLATSLADACPWADGAAREFFFDDALGRRDDADVASRGLGPARWWLVLGLTLNWLCCYACIFAGARSAGKAIWITMPLPYVLLFALAMKGASLPGSAEGVAFTSGGGSGRRSGTEARGWTRPRRFSASPSRAARARVREQLPAERCGRNAVVIAIAHAATSVFAGFVVFACSGHLARSERVPIADVAEGGWSLAFVAYPSAMALFQGPGAWQFFSVSFWLAPLPRRRQRVRARRSRRLRAVRSPQRAAETDHHRARRVRRVLDRGAPVDDRGGGTRSWTSWTRTSAGTPSSSRG